MALVGAAIPTSPAPGPRAPASVPPDDAAHAVEIVEIPDSKIELPALSNLSLAPEAVVDPPPLDPGGETAVARPDEDRAGRGGGLRASTQAINLADRDDGVLLTQEAMSRTDRSQLQRTRSSDERSAMEDRRSLEDPMELVFLADGAGRVQESRLEAPRDPSQGALRVGPPRTLGRPVAIDNVKVDPAAEPLPRASKRGSRRVSPGVGLLHSLPGIDHRLAARTASGRPMVSRDTVSVPAARTGPIRDSVDSQQEVASPVQSIVHASPAGGLPGEGIGGELGPAPTGAGGPEGLSGSRALPAGQGNGADPSYEQVDPRITAYRRAVLAKIAPLWSTAFPKWAALEGRQGQATIRFVLWPDGHVDGVAVARPSGIDEFDTNLRNAVLSAAPFPPLPESYAEPFMRWNISFDAMNPAVR